MYWAETFFSWKRNKKKPVTFIFHCILNLSCLSLHCMKEIFEITSSNLPETRERWKSNFIIAYKVSSHDLDSHVSITDWHELHRIIRQHSNWPGKWNERKMLLCFGKQNKKQTEKPHKLHNFTIASHSEWANIVR